MPLVSIIVSCYNGEKYIHEALNSLLNQTHSDLEIIIVNDGSTDNSERVIQSFSDTRIKYFKQSNKGQCAALNFGFGKSSGKYVKFYDADDILESKVIAGQVLSLENEQDDVISFIEWRRFYNDMLPRTINETEPHTIHKDCTPQEYVTWLGKIPMVQCGLWLIPRSLLLRTGLWDERLSLINDTEFFTRILTHVRYLKFSDSGHTFYRTNPKESSLSKDLSKKGIKSALLSVDLTSRWLTAIEDSERIKKIIVNGYIMVLEWAFPKQKLLVKVVERRLSRYPREYAIHTKSGKLFNIIMKFVGWKTAIRLVRFYNLKKNKSG